jgi:hypothetical protein
VTEGGKEERKKGRIGEKMGGREEVKGKERRGGKRRWEGEKEKE